MLAFQATKTRLGTYKKIRLGNEDVKTNFQAQKGTHIAKDCTTLEHMNVPSRLEECTYTDMPEHFGASLAAENKEAGTVLRQGMVFNPHHTLCGHFRSVGFLDPSQGMI